MTVYNLDRLRDALLASMFAGMTVFGSVGALYCWTS